MRYRTTALIFALGLAAITLHASAKPPEMPKPVVTPALNANALKAGEKSILALVVNVPAGYHAQSHTPTEDNVAFEVTPAATANVEAQAPVYPPGKEEDYKELGKLNVYTGKVTIYIPITVTAGAPVGPVTLTGKVHYQMCDDTSCFPPADVQYSIDSKIVAAGDAVEPANAELFKDYNPGAATKPATRAAAVRPMMLDDGSPKWGVFFALGAAFIAGILFNIVPCVLPMLPIKVLGFAAVAENDRGKTVLLASTFGLGIVTVFGFLAVLILVLKKITWGEQFSNPNFAWGMVLVLLLLSLWLFGVLNINLPPSMYAFEPSHDTFTGNYMLGILTAVLSTPCTGPLFPPLLLWAQSVPVYVGVPAMMMVGVGMAFPYVLLSCFPEVARKFPRTGAWAELFKQMLGFVLLAFTFFFAAGRFYGAAGQWWAVVPVVVMAALYLMARTVQISKEARPVAISALIAVSLVTASTILACQFSGVFETHNTQGGGGVKWVDYSDSTIEAAHKSGKIVLVKFTASWCLTCQYIESTVYHDEKAIDALRKYDVVTVKADLTKNDAPGWARLRRLSATGGIPFTAIYAPGDEKPISLASVYTTGQLLAVLGRAAEGTALATK